MGLNHFQSLAACDMIPFKKGNDTVTFYPCNMAMRGDLPPFFISGDGGYPSTIYKISPD